MGDEIDYISINGCSIQLNCKQRERFQERIEEVDEDRRKEAVSKMNN